MTRTRLEELEREFRSYRRAAERALAQVDDAALWRAHAHGENSIGILLQHMAGNLRSRFTDFLTSDGEKPDRDRDAEFEGPQHPTRDQVLAAWSLGWEMLLQATTPLVDADLDRIVTIRGEPHTVHRALLRSLAHMALHTGQIILLAKHWAGPGWQTLSIPRGESARFQTRPPAPG